MSKLVKILKNPRIAEIGIGAGAGGLAGGSGVVGYNIGKKDK